MISESTLAFAREHCNDDPVKLLLQRHRHPDVDMELAARQIEGRRQAAAKWPLLLQYPDYVYPAHLGREQSSSQATALYKASLASLLTADSPGPHRLLDLTGGMGIDDIFFARNGLDVDYIERNEELCKLSQHNFAAMGLTNIHCHCADSTTRQSNTSYDIIYADPARRDTAGRKTYAFSDCSPDIVALLPVLPPHRHLLVKASPMADIASGLQQLGHVAEVHVIAVCGECKELLFLVSSQYGQPDNPAIICTNLRADGTAISTHRFGLDQQRQTQPTYCSDGMGHYLYEPHAALMKAAPWGCLCLWYNVKKLDRNSHLYTSPRLVEGFPGRTFEVLREVPLNKKDIAAALDEHGSHGQANVISRNHPLAADTIRQKMHITPGGNLYLIATTVMQRPTTYLCVKTSAASE
ncbi:MAG: SAM-dependent methyltransferase [Bacteroidales bacterium]|nr:SAM-dependent methyltransferase [Bacteroidales bacterium]